MVQTVLSLGRFIITECGWETFIFIWWKGHFAPTHCFTVSLPSKCLGLAGILLVWCVSSRIYPRTINREKYFLGNVRAIAMREAFSLFDAFWGTNLVFLKGRVKISRLKKKLTQIGTQLSPESYKHLWWSIHACANHICHFLCMADYCIFAQETYN